MYTIISRCCITMDKRVKLLFFVTEDWFFCSHFLDRARSAMEEGYEIIVLTRVNKLNENIKKYGFKVIPIDLSRSGINPIKEIILLSHIIKIYWKEKPDLAHHAAFKPIIYGSLAAILSRTKYIINAPIGMGYVFISNTIRAKIIRIFILANLRYYFRRKNSFVIVENHDDQEMLINKGLVNPENIQLIRGAGVDLKKYHPTDEIIGKPQVILPARMLWDKGVGEFVQAARMLKKDGIVARFVLVGNIDEENPNNINQAQLQVWNDDGVVDWLGYQEDMPTVLSQSHIVCLPSYREGLPKSLIEAAAAGKPIVTTDVPGCREVVNDGVNGYLVPAKSENELAMALKKLILDSDLRKTMGAKSRAKAEQEFSVKRINSETLDLYEKIICLESSK